MGVGIKLQDLHLSGAQLPLFLWLPFDVPEAVTDEKLGWAELTTHLEAETVEGDSQRLAAL